MFSRGHRTTIFIVSMFMLLLLKDLLAKLIITCTLKDKLTTWLYLVVGYLASLHDLVSLKIEHTICSKMRCITNENTIDKLRGPNQKSAKSCKTWSYVQFGEKLTT
jgi:hypothetical protein